MNHWLLKSEPDTFSFDHLKSSPDSTEPWNGVRNYQARNFIRDSMRPGDLALFYHSSCPEPGVAGVAKIVSDPYPDPTQFDPASEYFDPKTTVERPQWYVVDVAWHAAFPKYVPLADMRAEKALAEMIVLRRGNRLSITQVTAAEFRAVCRLGGLKSR